MALMISIMPMIMMMMSLATLTMSMMTMTNNVTITTTTKLITMKNLQLPMNIIMDPLSTLFTTMIMIISSMIMIYSKNYINPNKLKLYNWLLMLFIMSMITLIITDNMILMILGWDGLGLTSYLLIVHYQNWEANTSGTITIMMNRLGDITILITIALLTSMNSWNILMSNKYSTMMIMMMMTAAMTKSAQYPFSAWLPAAMAAPTPISALVHSSTLVTAGVLLMVRTNTIIHPTSMKYLTMIALLTSTTASLSANWETDLKKMIALSTLSQVAFMMFALSMSMISLTMFHLFTHAMFKATMFMTAGMPIHSTSYQDTRKIKTKTNNSTLLMSTMSVTSLALMGLPFMAGFYSKDNIVETSNTMSKNSTMTFLMFTTIGLTTMYTMRLMTNLITTKSMTNTENTQTTNKKMSMSTLTLAPTSVLIGAVLSWIMVPQSSLSTSTIMKANPLSAILTGMMISTTMTKKTQYKMMTSMWLMNQISSIMPTKITHQSTSTLLMDQTWHEKSTPQLMQKSTKLAYKTTPTTQKTLTSIILTMMLMTLYKQS